MSSEPRLSPPETKGQLSVTRVTKAWYVAAFSSDLGQKPLKKTILGVPLVVYRTASGQVHALLDRCAHRNVPLSLGRVSGERIQCKYHGWEFDGQGDCQKVPGLCSEYASKSRHVPSYPTREQDGCVWIYLTPDTTPESEPFSFPLLDDPTYGVVRERVEAQGTMHAVIENALDVPHTAFLHRGLFRGVSEPNDIEVVVRRSADRIEAEYIGEPRPTGVVGKMLSPSGGVVTHYDRFILPCIAQVEYRIGTENHILVSAAATPVTDFFTELYAVVSFRLRVPHRVVKPVLTPIAMRIFAQDAEIIKHQTEVIQRFGGEQFSSTEIDVLGQGILRLLRQAERGDVPEGDAVVERRLRLQA